MSHRAAPKNLLLPALLCAGLVLVPAAVRAAGPDALVVYDGAARASEAFKTARTVEAFLGHFETGAVRLAALSEYAAGDALAPGFVFVVLEEDPEDLPPALLADLRATSAAIVWLGLHGDQLVAPDPGRWGFRILDWQERPDWTISYKDEDFPKEDEGLSVASVETPAAVRVFATARDKDGRVLPYALRSGRLWWFADSPFSYAMEGGRWLVFADLLHDILGQDHPPSRRALVRLEDVNAWSAPATLRSAAALLRRRRIPFQVALTPFAVDPAEQPAETALSETPKTVAALRDAVGEGGTIVLHGVTHQSRGVSGDDYEFWDDVAGVPIPHESPDWVDQRVRRGLRELFRNGLYPLAWETPHYSASQDDYEAFGRCFSVLYDRVMSAELSGTQILFPYECRLRGAGVLVVPENCGYVEVDRPDPAGILAAARRMRVVRDGIASFFFHPFVPQRHLKAIVDGMTAQGWTFVSLRDFPCVVRTESQWISSAPGPARIVAANQHVRRLVLGPPGSRPRETWSPGRERGLVEETAAPGPREIRVLEAVDFLPETRPGLWASLRDRAARLLRRRPVAAPPIPLARALVLSGPRRTEAEANEEASFAFVLRIYGLHPDVREARGLTAESLRAYSLVVVPGAAARALGDFEANALFGFVEEGGSLVASGRSAFAERLGLSFGPAPVRVGGVRDLTFPVRDLVWSPPVEVEPPSAPEASVVARDAASETPVELLVTRGRGRVLFLAASFDPATPFGISRYAHFPRHLRSVLGTGFNVRRNSLEFYFDPGFRPDASREKLVEQWRDSGVRVIYVAAWHFYESYTFDYAGFIDLCHANGIAVYAWFELPQVSPRFWDEHPEWREKTLAGDSRSSWRLQMNLANADARAAARAFYGGLLRAHDWDGLVLAELGFDTNKGTADPRQFTPMNADVRREFRASAGFDPADLFDEASPRWFRRSPASLRAFLDFRRALIVRWHREFLDEALRVRREKGRDLEIVVTALDSVLHPEIVEECGVDTRDVAALMAEYPFTLQVEDPARSWAGPPSRYRDLAAAYREIVPDPRRLMFDINCIPRDVAGRGLPSSVPTGTELAATVFFASFASGRAGIYSESTVPPFDMDLLPYVLGADVEIRPRGAAYEIDAKEPVSLAVDRPDLRPLLDGEPWPFYGPAGISLPSGRSLLSFEPAGWMESRDFAPRMTFGGEVERLERRGRAYLLAYRSPYPVPIGFNRTPSGLSLDGAEAPAPAAGRDLVLPAGRHVLEIRPESPPSRAVGIVGYLSSSVFFLAGLLSVPLLLGIYLYVRARG